MRASCYKRRGHCYEAGVGKKSIQDKARAMVGDGKTPNKYWVTIGSDYHIFDPVENTFDWASEIKGIKAKGKTIKMFDTYAEAKSYAEGISLGNVVEGIKVNNIVIEDRLSGQVWENVKGIRAYEDIKFTKETEAKRGVKSSMKKVSKTSKVNAGNLVNYIMDYEGGEISQDDTLELFSYLIKTGQAWSLQGMYGRQAKAFIDAGVITKEGKIQWDKVY
jgi:hypothetical protein